MKKLEKIDGKLFESLKPNEMSNLGALVGGDKVRYETTGEKSKGCEDVGYAWVTGVEFPRADTDVIDSDWNTDKVNPFEDPSLVAEPIVVATAN